MKPYKIFLQILVIVTAAELLTMAAVSGLGLRGGAYVFADAGLLVLLSAPFIHMWVVNGATRAYSLEAFLARTALEREESMREKAEASERRFRSLVGHLDAIVYEADAATGKFHFVSERAESILGYPAGRWIADPDFWIGMIHPDDRERAAERRRSATAEKREYRMEYRVLAADGRVVNVLDSVRVTRDEAGRPRQIHGVMLDLAGLSGSPKGLWE
jgi:PAS domain S-box-containing protein